MSPPVAPEDQARDLEKASATAEGRALRLGFLADYLGLARGHLHPEAAFRSDSRLAAQGPGQARWVTAQAGERSRSKLFQALVDYPANGPG